jgi:hypothetical protein
MTLFTDALTRFLVDQLDAVELQTRQGFTYDRVSGRYRNNATGRYISEREIVQLVESYSQTVSANLKALTERFVRGELDLSAWQTRFMRELKDGYIIAATAGRGGRAAMTQADWGRVGGRLANEARHLNGFAQAVYNGNMTTGQILYRADLYAGGVRTAYFDGRSAAAVENDLTEERRILGESEHCDDCAGYAAQGWVMIGGLPEPGDGSVCRHNCQCEKEYR